MGPRAVEDLQLDDAARGHLPGQDYGLEDGAHFGPAEARQGALVGEVPRSGRQAPLIRRPSEWAHTRHRPAGSRPFSPPAESVTATRRP